jgi:hypothetical protein
MQQPVAQLAHKEIVQQPVGLFGQYPADQIPWGHNILIFTKSKDVKEAAFYIEQTIAGHWSRDRFLS